MKRMMLSLLIVIFLGSVCHAEAPLKALLIDGQNNHAAMPRTTPMIIDILENSGLFKVTHTRTPKGDGRKPNYAKPQPTVADMPEALQQEWAKWRPDFSKYDVIVSNYNGVLWPGVVRASFEKYMREGGGFVSIHAADNAFSQWKEYNRMIAVGGWYGRTEKDGPRIQWKDGALVCDPSAGRGGSHDKRTPVLVENRSGDDHPITKGMPAKWLHPADEVYMNMRGPAENITVLATGLADVTVHKNAVPHPNTITVTYGEGRIYHEMFGHDEQAFFGVGFQNMLIRGAEWAASGKVTYKPAGLDRLSSEKIAAREPKDIK